MTVAFEATALAKRYGRTWALRDCTLAVPEGRVAALVGPNGAGKTTLLRLAVGLRRPTRGAVRVFGRQPRDDPGSLADLVGRRRVFVTGLVVFTAASAACGLSGSPLALNLFRAVQGTGGAMMFATSLALIASAFHGPERGLAFGVYGGVIGAAVAVGLTEESRVRDWLTKNPETIDASDTTEHAAALMIHGGFRHLPVLDGGAVVGIVSIRDLMRVTLDDSAPRGV